MLRDTPPTRVRDPTRVAISGGGAALLRATTPRECVLAGDLARPAFWSEAEMEEFQRLVFGDLTEGGELSGRGLPPAHEGRSLGLELNNDETHPVTHQREETF
jgi:hypothetical protein